MKTSIIFIALLVSTALATAQGTWQQDDIGQAPYPGTFTVNQNGYGLQSSGLGIGIGWTEDNFEFVHQPWAGDGDFTAQLTSVQGPADQALAGLMVRDGLGTNSAFFMIGLTAEGKLVLDSRDTTGENSQNLLYSVVPLEQIIGLQPVFEETNQDFLGSSIIPGAAWLGTNCWLTIERRGNLFSAYASADGQTWFWLGSENVSMAQPIAGMAVAGISYVTATAAEFQQVSLRPSDFRSAGIPAQPVVGSGDGLLGTYQSVANGNTMQRIDPVIDYQWGLGGPSTNIGVDLFEVQWTGMIQAQYSETYNITAVSEDGARLWLDDRLLIDEWHEQHPPLTTTVPISLTAGQKYTFRLDYYAGWGIATAQLFWSSPSTPRQIIPQSQLYSTLDQPLLVDVNSNGIPDRWERTYGLFPDNQVANPSGIPYFLEYLTRMDPVQSVASTPLSGGWLNRDIGDVGIPGTAVLSGNQIAVSGSGSDIYNSSDSFQYVYQPWHGDVQIIARVNPLAQDSDFQAKAGLMIREDLTGHSKNALVAKMTWNGLTIQHRMAFSGPTTFRSWYDKSYNWVKLVRRGNAFEMYASVDGVIWNWLNTENVEMGPDVFVGLAVTSHDNTRFCSAKFSNIQIGPPDAPENPYAAAALGDGLQATYTDLGTGTVVQRVDTNIDFDWGLNPPAPDIDPHNFSVEWDGLLEAPYDETFDFRVGSDAPVRLWIDDQLVIDWNTTPEHNPGNHDFYGDWLKTVFSYKMQLKAAHQYKIRLDCLSTPGGRSIAKLYWSSRSTPAQPIPQNLFYSPTNQYYGQLPDSAGVGMPDAWQIAYFGHTGVDPKGDPDQDTLSNLQEYLAGTNPLKADSNDDGIPDWWAVKYGLIGEGDSITSDDPAGDGLNNLQKYQLGLDPTKPIFNGNSLASFDLVVESGNDPLNGNQLVPNVITEVSGSAIAGQLGEWAKEANAIYAVSRRGYVEYDLNVPAAGMFRLDVWGSAMGTNNSDSQFPLILSVDGEYMGRQILSTSSFVSTLTPWLQPGVHRVKVYWDNAAENFTPLEITSVKLMSLTGADNNGNGISDWIDYRLRLLSGFSAGAAPALASYVSPYCLEGHEYYSSTMTLSNGAGQPLTINPGADPNWYANVPLDPLDATIVNASFENGGLAQTANIKWVPLDIASTNQVTIRKGDSLLLEAGSDQGWSEQATFTVPGVTNYTGVQPVPIQFGQVGTYTVTGSPVGGSQPSQSIQVTVVDVASPMADALAWVSQSPPLGIVTADWNTMASVNIIPAWLGNSRSSDAAQMPADAVIQPGVGLSLQPTNGLPQPGGSFSLQVNDATINHVIARLGQSGPILGGNTISGFQLYSAYDTGIYVVQVYPDGSQLIETSIVMSPIQANVIVNLRLIVGGVMFEDGTIEKNLTAKDFDELGVATFRFIRPPEAVNSVCHRISIYEGIVPIGEF